MIRRATALGLLVVGAVLIARIARHPTGDTLRTLAIVGVVAGGLAFNLVAFIRRYLDVRPGFRALVGAVGVVLLIGVLAARHRIGVSALPSVPQTDVALRATLLAGQAALLELSIGLAYLVLSIAVLPWPERAGHTANTRKEDGSGSDPAGGAAGGS